MILKFISQSVLKPAQIISYNYASAAASAIDYYSLLGVEKGATTEQIQKAFRKLTRNVNPDSNSSLFTRLTQAFVILSDNKSRDAYDSLSRSRKISYINDPAPKKTQPSSYIADRKQSKSQVWAKRFNLDKYGRYRGGVPTSWGTRRGKSLGDTGVLYMNGDQISVATDPEFTKVDASVAQSFKNYHQDQRQNRTMKRPWKTLNVEYQYFSIRRILDTMKFWKYFIFFFLLAPAIIESDITLYKRASKWIKDREIRLKVEKAERQAKQLQQKARKERQKKQAEEKKAKQAQQQKIKQAQAEQAKQVQVPQQKQAQVQSS